MKRFWWNYFPSRFRIYLHVLSNTHFNISHPNILEVTSCCALSFSISDAINNVSGHSCVPCREICKYFTYMGFAAAETSSLYILDINPLLS